MNPESLARPRDSVYSAGLARPECILKAWLGLGILYTAGCFDPLQLLACNRIKKNYIQKYRVLTPYNCKHVTGIKKNYIQKYRVLTPYNCVLTPYNC